MAERRMFAKTIIDSDAFLDMPASAQALYFHLCMRADDDGFLNNPKKIQRLVGAADDDLKLLLMKRFILAFESGVIVIKHWKIHNYLRNDRYKPTIYQEELHTLRLKENKAYTDKPLPPISIADTDGIPDGYHMDTDGIPSAYQMETQVRLVKDKGSVGEECLVKEIKDKVNTHTEECVVDLAREEPTPQQKEHKPLKASDRVKALNYPKLLEDTVIQWLKYKYNRHELPRVDELDALLTIITAKANEAGAEAVAEVIKTSIASGYKAIVFDRIKPIEHKAGSRRLEDCEDLDAISGELDGFLAKMRGE